MMKHLSILATAMLLVSTSMSQVIQDAQLWKGVILEKTILKDKLKVSLNEEVRLVQNFSTAGNAYTDILPEFKFNKRLSLGVGYRYSVRPDENVHRIYSDFTWEPKRIERFSLSFRTRFLRDMTHVNSKNVFRQKIEMAYNLPKTKMEPYLGAEPFFRADDGFRFYNYRLIGGIRYPINKNTDLRVGYIWAREVGNVDNELDHVLTIRVSVNLDKGDSKKKEGKKSEDKED